MKIAVWGLGTHVIKNILPAIKEVKGLDLVGCSTRDIIVTERVAKEYNCNSWTNPSDMLKEDIDIVYLGTPPGLHFEQGLKILNSNKHFWCEKPFTVNLKDTLKLVEVAEAKDLSVCEGFMYLYHPHYLHVKNYLTNSLLGEVRTVKIDFGLPEIKKPGYRNDLSLGGSCFYDVGSYVFSLLSDCFDLEDMELVYSNVVKDKSTGVDQGGVAHIIIKSQINCILEWTYNRSYKNDITIWADKGMLYSDKIFSKDSSFSPKIELKNINGQAYLETISSSNHFVLMLKSVLDNIEDLKNRKKERERLKRLSFLMEEFKNTSSL